MPSILAFLVSSLALCAQVTTVDNSTCPPVSPRSRKEVLDIAASQGKKGCWIRDKKTGLLMFVSPIGQKDNHPPLVDSFVGKTMTLRDWSTTAHLSAPSGSQDLAGTWSIISGTYPGIPELGLFGPGDPAIRNIEGVRLLDTETTRVILTKKPTGQYCGAAFGVKEICFTKTGATSYVLSDPKPDSSQHCEFNSDGRILRGKCLRAGTVGAGTLIIGVKSQ